jgi:hypothetical protein
VDTVRIVLCATIACLGLALAAAPARAQGLTNFFQPGQRASTFGTGSAQTIVNQPIDTGAAIAPFPGQREGTQFLPSFFHNFHIPGFPPAVGTSPLPPPSAFPSTQYPDFKAVPFVPANPQATRFFPFGGPRN